MTSLGEGDGHELDLLARLLALDASFEGHVHQTDPSMNDDDLVPDFREELLELPCFFDGLCPVPDTDGAAGASSAFNPEAGLSYGEGQLTKHLLF